MQSETAHASIRIIRFPELHCLVGLSRTQTWRLEKEGLFPNRIQLGKNSIGWVEADVIAWIEERRSYQSKHAACITNKSADQ